MAQMSKAELLTVIKGQLQDTIKYANDDFKSVNLDISNAYNQEPYGNEEEGHSQVISSDVYDQVESDTPSLARVFLASSEIMKFMPLGRDDVEEAEQKTKYANYIIRGQRDSFKTQIDFLKQAGKAKCAVLKYYIEEEEKPEYVNYEGVSEDEMVVILQELESQDHVARVEPIEHDTNEETFNVRFRVVKKTKKIRVKGVPPDNFIMTVGAASKDEAPLVGDEYTKTKGELIAEGYDTKLIKDLPPNKTHSELEQKRLKDQGGYDAKTGYHWTLEEVTVQDLYPLVDYDGDGIPERRHILKIGEKILENEPFSQVPYAILSQVVEPHLAIGRSRGEQAARYQEEKTAIKRGLMDNIYEVNRPRIGVDDSEGSIDGGKADLDDLLAHQIGGVIRTDGRPLDVIMPIETPYIGDKALQVIQYIDSEKSQTLGQMLANQGLNADKLYNETATRFEGVQDAHQAKLELVARVAAETAYRDLYEGVIWLAQHYQDEATEIMVLGEPLTVDPKQWRYEHYCQSQVGLGAGDTADAIENLSAQFNVQMLLKQQGSPLVDDKKLYNTLEDLIKVIGKPDAMRYYNDPEKPQQLLLAQNEQLQQMVAMLQQQVQQNPLAEAELIKAKARMAEVQGKESSSMRQFIAKQMQEDRHFWANHGVDLAKLEKEWAALELQHNQDIPERGING